jgi:uncharacterized membrane protein YdjX (TVP38/TMEM64 family)
MSATWKRVAVIVATVAVGAFLAHRYTQGAWTLDGVREALASYGAWAPAIYIAAYVLATVLFLPGGLLTVAAGVLFGPFIGILWAWIGGSLGALAAYAVGRGGSGPVHEFLHTRVARLAHFVDDHSFGSVLTLRLVPLVPFNLLNYALGFAGVRAGAYVPATLIGVIPGTTAYVLFGAALGNVSRFREPAFYLPLVAAILLTIVASVLSTRLRRRSGGSAADADGP